MEQQIEERSISKAELKEKKKQKRKLKRENEMKKFCSNHPNEDMLYQFMKKFSMIEKQALEQLSSLHIIVTKKQIKFAKERRKAIKLANKQKRLRKQAHKLERKQREAYEEYVEHVISQFCETGEISSVQDYLIIKDEFF